MNTIEFGSVEAVRAHCVIVSGTKELHLGEIVEAYVGGEFYARIIITYLRPCVDGMLAKFKPVHL